MFINGLNEGENREGFNPSSRSGESARLLHLAESFIWNFETNCKMDIISQLQEQINTIASLAFNSFGTLQRDAPPVRLSPNYPEPSANPSEDTLNITEQPKLMSAALVKAAKQFDTLVTALPVAEGDEEAQLKRITELEAENEAVGQELQRQLEAAEQELKHVQELFNQAVDNCVNLKKPD
ncbi:hypothetical protein NE237_005748 [Protea cynaroides]|uniref:Mediator of RNA polymerase II transcription subunit 21 n=1 Tax=Protea cynaroides TaxID=273540 RepID=A0A9Q0KLA1_9MAGN|nr:hypothetical protein NE237_005748 [Protea cynaroides]